MEDNKGNTIKRIIGVVVFLCLFYFLLTRITYIVRTNGDTKNRFAGYYAQRKDSIDVMFFGSSATSTTFSPGKMYGDYGFTSYLLSSNSQSPEAISILLDECYKYQSPEVVVIDIRMFMNSPQKVDSDEGHIREVTDNMKYSFNRIKAINKLEKDSSKRISYYFDIIKYHSNWGLLFKRKEWKNINYCHDYETKGFEIIKDCMPQDRYEYTGEIVPEKIAEEYEKELCEIMSKLKSKDQKAVFVSTPVAVGDQYIYKLKYIQNLVENSGFAFLEMNEYYDEIGIDFATDFKEGAHLNIKGADKSSDYMGRYLVNNYSLPDHRGNEKFDKWNLSYEYYMQELEIN